MSRDTLTVGYIPLVDAAALIVAVDKGFAADEGLGLHLVREASWSNVRDKLNLGLLDAAHLLAPMAIASGLGIGHVRVPLVAPLSLGLNGNAVTVSHALFAELAAAAEGGRLADPMVSAAALARVVAARARRGAEPPTFGMTFPFSNHNYQLRFWMAAGAIDPDEDVRLVVLPPPYMVESLTSGHIDGFCVGAPWSSVAVDLRVGRILHFGCDIVARACEKVLALRAARAAADPDTVLRLVRALHRASDYLAQPGNHAEAAALLARPERIAVPAEMVRRSLAGELMLAPEGHERRAPHYLMLGGAGVGRPDPVQAAWLYAQMVRWRQAPLSEEMRAAAMAAFRPDLFDAAVGREGPPADQPADHVGAFAGPPFAADDIAAYLDAWPRRAV